MTSGAIPLRGIINPSRLSGLVTLVRREPIGALSALVLLAVIVVAIFAHAIAPYDPLRYTVEDQLVGPRLSHLLGTDQFGRDVFSRLVFGARISLLVAVTSVGLSLTFGTALGLISGFWAGKVPDNAIQRVMDAMLAVPVLVLAISIMAILGIGLTQVIIAIGITHIPLTSRIVRGTVVSAKENLYVEAATALGASAPRIMVRHILPNVTAPIIIMMTLGWGNAIMIEASLSFLGFGSNPEDPSWGGMLSRGALEFFESAPWLAIFPGAVLGITIMSINLFGDSLRDLLDPRIRK